MRRLYLALTVSAILTNSAIAGFLLDFGTAVSEPGAFGVTDRWVPGDLGPHVIQANDLASGAICDVEFAFSDPNGLLASQDGDAFSLSPGVSTPYVEGSLVSGFLGVEGLIWRIDANDNTVRPVELTITFPEDVTNLQFSIGDIDVGARNIDGTPRFWQDMVSVTGIASNAAIVSPGGSIVDGNRVVSVGSGVYKGVPSSGVTDVPDSLDQGNVDLIFPSPVQSVTILFQPGPDVSTVTATQWISLSDLTFDKASAAIPEPSSFAFLATIGVGILGYRRNRRMAVTSLR